MSDEFRIEVAQVERPEGGVGRVHLRLIAPDGIEGAMVNRSLVTLYVRELGPKVELRARRWPWGDGLRYELKDDAAVIALRGLAPAHQVRLEWLAGETAEACNRDLAPDGATGSRLHAILERLGPR